MYCGIGIERGKRVYEEDAFGYAMDRITSDRADAEEFCHAFAGCNMILGSPDDLAKFRDDVVEWFYSGNWVKEEKDAETI